MFIYFNTYINKIYVLSQKLRCHQIINSRGKVFLGKTFPFTVMRFSSVILSLVLSGVDTGHVCQLEKNVLYVLKIF